MSTGATDGLYFRQAGIPIYGVSGLFGDMDDVRAHGRDERDGREGVLRRAGISVVARHRAHRNATLNGAQARTALVMNAMIASQNTGRSSGRRLEIMWRSTTTG